MRFTTTLAVSVLLLLPMAAMAQTKKPAKESKELKAFRAFLNMKFPGKKWQIGPKEITGKAINQVYGGNRFFYVFSSPPLPPGARIKSVIDAYQRRLQDFRKNYISLTVKVDAKGNMQPLLKPAEFGKGLKPVGNAKEAQRVAAAALSVFGSGRAGPGLVSPEQMKVTKSANGLNCSVHVRNRFVGSVAFDKQGRLIRISKSYAGPFPP